MSSLSLPPPVPPRSRLCLVTDLSTRLDQHCTLCLLFDMSTNECSHWPSLASLRCVAQTPSTLSVDSFHTARTSGRSQSTGSGESIRSYRSSSSGSSSETIRALLSDSPDASPTKPLFLRRRKTPKTESLRDLRAKHSEDCLKRVYEEQLHAYLSAPDQWLRG